MSPDNRMMVEYKFIESLSRREMDRYLSDGWLKHIEFFAKIKFMCLDEKISSIVSIRLPLKKYSYKKSHRRIVRNVEKNFTVRTGAASMSGSKELLYEAFKERLHGFIFFKLSDFLTESGGKTLFDTYEISVYDNEKLIAVSFFDRGEKSLNSIFCLYDRNYDKYSLGSYTMIKEIQYGLSNGFEHYYPGHILDTNGCYDYKLGFGDMEYLNKTKGWVKMEELPAPDPELEKIESAVNSIERELALKGIPYIKRINPFYAYGFVQHFSNTFIKSILPVFITVDSGEEKLLVEYDPKMDIFILYTAGVSDEYRHFIEAQDISYYNNDSVYLTELYTYNKNLARHRSISVLVENFIIPELEKRDTIQRT